jgi:hypothetical protein
MRDLKLNGFPEEHLLYCQVMKSIVFLSCDDLTGYVTDEHLVVPLLESAGWKVDTRSWTEACDWSQYDAAIVRTTWDYTERLDEFLQKMNLISQQTTLMNSLSTIQWNCQKSYLKDLIEWNVRIIPTRFEWPANWSELFMDWQTQKIMLKPQVGANSSGTYVITPENIPSAPLFTQKPLIQPFREKILSEGEWSFHFFLGHFSHAIRKVPKSNDFRVQEEHGGTILSEIPSAEDLKVARDFCKMIETQRNESMLFLRLDMVRNNDNELEVMEVELIEPSLYFRTHSDAAKNFITALQTKIM